MNIEWPESGDPSKLSNFETVARRLRFMALGKACLERNIKSLLVAHHQDDQVETVLMRMSQGHRGAGLKCILPVSDMPECWGIHAVHTSGASELTEKIKALRGQKLAQIEDDWDNRQGTRQRFHPRHGDENSVEQDTEEEQSPPLKIQDGSIKVYRPFLGFAKGRLEATCLALRVNWVEDETNHDPALTPRNAIRQILKLGRLPEAIQKTSLLALVTRMRHKIVNRNGHADKIFRKCEIRMLDTRVGAVIVRFPIYDFDRKGIPTMYLHQAMLNKEYTFALSLRHMIGLVTPLERVTLKSLNPAVKAIFPKLLDDAGEQMWKFTCGQVNFERARSALAKPKPNTRLDPEFVWILTRKPYASTRPSPSITFSATASPSESSNSALWDGRFWFCVRNQSPRPVVVRPLYPADLTSLRDALPEGQVKDLNEILRVVAPGKTRWTLPVIAEAEEETPKAEADQERAAAVSSDVSRQDTGRDMKKSIPNFKESTGGKVLALPTLSLDFGAKEKGISWEVRYKHVNLDRGKVGGLMIL